MSRPLALALLLGGVIALTPTEPSKRVGRVVVAKVRPLPSVALPGTLERFRKPLENAAIGNGLSVVLLAAKTLQEVRDSDPSAIRPEPVPQWITQSPLLDGARAKGWTNQQLAASYGLGQVLGATAWGLGYRGTPQGLLEPSRSLELGARYLRLKLKRWKSPRLALVAYNGGDGAAAIVSRGGNHPSSIYAAQVLARMDALVRGDTKTALV